MKAIKVSELGDTSKLQLTDLPEPVLQSNQVKIKINTAGINFIDIYYRKGVYKRPLPFIPGEEAAGVITERDDQVNNLKVGDRVVYCMVGGSYAEFNCVPANKVVKIPDNLSFKQATASLLQGLTAHYLTKSTYSIKPNDIALVHAAAGGVGLLLVQTIKNLGGTVIGTASSKEKIDLVKKFGADYVINYQEEDFCQKVKELVGKVNVVYDSVGKDTFIKSMECLKPRGYMILFGQSSGVVESINPGILGSKGSIYLTRPSLTHYTSTKEELQSRADELFKWITDGKLNLTIDSEFPLVEVTKAHERLEKRLNKGKVLINIK